MCSSACRGVVQCVAMCVTILEHLNMVSLLLQYVAVRVAMCCNVLRRVRLDPRTPEIGLSLVVPCCRARCNVLQCVAICCNACDLIFKHLNMVPLF